MQIHSQKTHEWNQRNPKVSEADWFLLFSDFYTIANKKAETAPH